MQKKVGLGRGVDGQVGDVKASDRFPVLKSKLNKSLVEFFLQDDGADESVYIDQNSSILGAM